MKTNPTPAPGRLRAKKALKLYGHADSLGADLHKYFDYPDDVLHLVIPCDPESLAALKEKIARTIAVPIPHKDDLENWWDIYKEMYAPLWVNACVQANAVMRALGLSAKPRLPESLPCKEDPAGRGKRK